MLAETKTHPHIELVQQACRFIQMRAEQEPSLNEISAALHISPFHLQRTFKRVMGITPKQFAERQRLEAFKLRLRAGVSVTDALYDVGYGSTSRVYERAPEQMGMTPAAYRKGGAGMRINYVIVECHLGLLLVGRTQQGICSVHLGRNEAELQACLFDEYPAAEIQRNQDGLCEYVEALLEHLKGARPHLDLPLDIQASAFQLRVWQALREIPYGETRTYSEIAESIGQPGAATAVAKAVHANRTVLLIPCHRAAREDGEPTRCYDERERFSMLTLRDNERQHSEE
ncbi:MAG: methylated-DNA--[protein]-cysteine S-methyltransferase [Anaerolineae bacterium]|nr:methylated-DNA--[protein]-cysteine S-methyltransferase [Anaerolineae bacterium]